MNGAIGTVLTISARCISVKFDHSNDPCDIERVKSAFMVMKNYYIYRTQFPLILAYAVTIHKCQGLSLDCAIVDLSSKVFADCALWMQNGRWINAYFLVSHFIALIV